jgi:hypothetical protein
MEELVSFKHILAVIMTLTTIFTSIVWYFAKKENRQLEKEHEKKITELEQKFGLVSSSKNKPIIQLEKVIYEKFLYIKQRNNQPVYKAYVKRINEYTEVYDEKFSVRINKFSSITPITTRDRSSGIIDLLFLLPFREKLNFPDQPSRKDKHTILQDLYGEDTYISTGTYYNGFQPGSEDLASKMEMDTEVFRFIADFSSIPDIEEIMKKSPNLYKLNLDESRLDITNKIKEVGQAIFYVEVKNLKKGEVIYFDFHINWDYLNQKNNKTA